MKWLGLTTLILCLGCGHDEGLPPTVASLRRDADRYAEEGNWAAAADSYGRAFAFEDPVPERRQARALLAHRRGSALAPAGRPLDALAWLRWAERLDPSLTLVALDRARILDGTYPRVADPRGAVAEYRRFLEAHYRAGAPDAEKDLADYARIRLEAMAPSVREAGGGVPVR